MTGVLTSTVMSPLTRSGPRLEDLDGKQVKVHCVDTPGDFLNPTHTCGRNEHVYTSVGTNGCTLTEVRLERESDHLHRLITNRDFRA